MDMSKQTAVASTLSKHHHVKVAQSEITLTFEKKPLGIGLVPSTQLYGAWEVGHVPDDQPSLAIGDVLMAVNGDDSVNEMDVLAFRSFISKLPVPLSITFRKPRLHGHCDSHMTATALFPQSVEYNQFMRGSTRHVRATAAQWKQSAARDVETAALPIGRDAVGDITVTIQTLPVGVTFGASTRSYGSLEVHALAAPSPCPSTPSAPSAPPAIHSLVPGDVLLAVNGRPEAASWTLAELMSRLQVQ